MRDEIIEKLNNHLGKSEYQEIDTVYLFVQVRKLLEHSSAFDRYPVLQFYCNWVVHTKLDRINSQPALFKLIDDLNKAVALLKMGSGFKDNALSRLSNAISDKKLRDELRRFFLEYSLESGILEPKTWVNLYKSLIGVLIDLPLVPAPNDFNFIKEFRFIKATDETHIARIKIVSPNGEEHEGPLVLKSIEETK